MYNRASDQAALLHYLITAVGIAKSSTRGARDSPNGLHGVGGEAWTCIPQENGCLLRRNLPGVVGKSTFFFA